MTSVKFLIVFMWVSGAIQKVGNIDIILDDGIRPTMANLEFIKTRIIGLNGPGTVMILNIIELGE
jgi:hypothetical protein